MLQAKTFEVGAVDRPIWPRAGISFLLGNLLTESAESKDLAPARDAPPDLRRDTKKVGDLSEAIALAALVRAGYGVSKPFGENQRYDFIIDDGRRLARVQVKTGRLRNGAILFSCCSTHGHRNGPSSRPYSGEIEFLAVYCPQNEKVYLLPESEMIRTKGHLRVAPTANRQAKGVRWATQFELP